MQHQLPPCYATRPRRRTEPPPLFLSTGAAALTVSAAEMALRARELAKSAGVAPRSGLSVTLPAAYATPV